MCLRRAGRRQLLCSFTHRKRFDGYKGQPAGVIIVTAFKTAGQFYFANRDNDFPYSFRCDVKTARRYRLAALAAGGRFRGISALVQLTERWMLVANQDSIWSAGLSAIRKPARWRSRQEPRSRRADEDLCGSSETCRQRSAGSLDFSFLGRRWK